MTNYNALLVTYDKCVLSLETGINLNKDIVCIIRV